MTVVREETFGPVSPIITLSNVGKAIQISNGTAFGLSSGICTNRMDNAMRFTTELKVATVNMWEVPSYRIELTPFGGIKGLRAGLQGRCAGGHEVFLQWVDFYYALALSGRLRQADPLGVQA